MSPERPRRPIALATGFEPFAYFTANPSALAVEALAMRAPDRVAARRLPVDHHAAPKALLAALEAVRPEVCLLTGLAPERMPRLERRARTPAAAALPMTPKTRAGAWRWDAAQSAMEAAGAPCRHSFDCGLYVCETTYRALLEHRARAGWPRSAAFLHVPPISSEWPLERIVAAVAAALASELAVREHAA